MTETVKLTHGAEMPRLGLGTYPMSDAAAEIAIPQAAELGYRLFDTAYAYHNETGVGRGLKASGLPRAELFLTTKLNGNWHGYDLVQNAFAESAERLGVDYFDLYLIHWPLPQLDRYVDAWRGLAKLLEDGKVRAIGGSNFKPAHLDRLIAETGVTPDVNQIQLNPTVTRDAVRAYDEAHGIVTQSWAPLGKGTSLLSQSVITEIAERHGRTPSQIVLRWHLQLGLCVIPKTVTPQRMADNIAVFDFTLTDAEIASISGLDQGEDAAVDSDVQGH